MADRRNPAQGETLYIAKNFGRILAIGILALALAGCSATVSFPELPSITFSELEEEAPAQGPAAQQPPQREPTGQTPSGGGVVVPTEGNGVDILVGSCYTNNVLRFDGDTGEYLGEFISAGAGGLACPEGEMIVGDDGFLYVTSFSFPPLRQPWEPIIQPPAAAFFEGEALESEGGQGATGDGVPAFERTPPAVTYNDQVLRFDAATGEFVDVFLPPNALLNGPHGLAFTKNGGMFVATRFSSSLLIYDRENREVSQVVVENGAYQLAEGISPGLTFRDTNSISVGPDGQVYVASYEAGEVYLFDEETGALLDRFVNAEDDGHPMNHPHNVLFGPDGNLYVTDIAEGQGSNSVLRFDGATGEFMDVFIDGQNPVLGYPSDMVFMPDGSLVLVDCAAGSVIRYDGVTGEMRDVMVPPGAGLPPGATSIVTIPKSR